MTAIFLFTRDFRLVDNLALNYACKNFKKVLLLFCLNPEQINSSNKYRSINSIAFMIESLVELKKKVKEKLLICSGKPEVILKKLIKSNFEFEEVVLSEDYTPYASKRLTQIRKAIGDIKVTSITNHLLNNTPILNQQGKF